MLYEFVTWWYGRGWLEISRKISGFPSDIRRFFAVGLLAANLFAPWRRIVTPPGRSLDEKLRALIDNLVSRTVGFVIRFFTLLAALFLMVLSAWWGLILAAAWPLLPIALLYCLIRSITG